MRSSIACGLIAAAAWSRGGARPGASASRRATQRRPRPAALRQARSSGSRTGAGSAMATRARGVPPVPRLSARNLAFAGFAAYVRRPANQMPPYTEKVVSNADLVNIHAFIQSRPAPPAVSQRSAAAEMTGGGHSPPGALYIRRHRVAPDLPLDIFVRRAPAADLAVGISRRLRRDAAGGISRIALNTRAFVRFDRCGVPLALRTT